MRDDQSSRGRFEGFDAFQDADGEATPRQQERGKQSGGRPANHRNSFSLILAGAGNGIAFLFARCPSPAKNLHREYLGL
jgi:hypothetical protein